MTTMSYLQGKRVLVTGGAGFLGRPVCERLADHQPASVFVVRSAEHDLRDREAVRLLLRHARPEVIIHLAAQALVLRGYEEPKLTFDTNVGGAINLLEVARSTPSVQALVFVTSDKCYLNKEWIWAYRENDELGGADPYSGSKAAAELIFASYQASYFLHRPGFALRSD